MTQNNTNNRIGLTASTELNSQLIIGIVAATAIAAMYGATLFELFTKVWTTDDQMHGPLILLASLWLAHLKLKSTGRAKPTETPSNWGWLWLTFGILLFIVGRSQSTYFLEVGSLIPTLAGLVLLTCGSQTLRTIGFPIAFLIFMAPLPDALIDGITVPMKITVSYFVEKLMSLASYPIGRDGVILQLGQYKLLVADACAGMHTLLALESMGLLYINIVKHTSALRNIALTIFIVPISIAANVIRVIVLAIITYHFGDEAGQGFLHGFAGIVLFLSGLLIIISLDTGLRWISNHRTV